MTEPASPPAAWPGDEREQRDVLAITGSVRFEDPTALGKVAAIIAGVLDTQPPDVVAVETLRGVPHNGVATVAEQAARCRGIPVRYVNAANDRWAGRGGYLARKYDLVEVCTRLLDFRCRDDARWTAQETARLASRRGIPVERLWNL